MTTTTTAPPPRALANARIALPSAPGWRTSSSRAGTSTPIAASWADRLTRGAGPGRAVADTQEGGNPGRTPAWTNELLPAPDGPTTARSGDDWRRLTNAAVSRSRPVNASAS